MSQPPRQATRGCPACGQAGAVAQGEENGWALARCSRCGVRFTIDVPDDAQLNAIYERLYADGVDAYQRHLNEVRRIQADGTNSAGGFYRSRIFLNRYPPAAGDRLLEVGCGVGTFLMLAQEKGWTVEGIDLSEAAVSASQAAHRLPVRVGSFFDLDFEEGAYRAIVAWEVLEHLPDPQEFLAKARRLLRPGGVVACSVPNEGRKVPYPLPRGPASVPPVHLNFWDRAALTKLFTLNGFRVLHAMTQRTMRVLADPRDDPMRFLRLQAGALVGAYEGIHLFIAATPEP